MSGRSLGDLWKSLGGISLELHGSGMLEACLGSLWALEESGEFSGLWESGGSLEVSWRYLRSLWEVSGGSLGGFWEVSGKYLRGGFRRFLGVPGFKK